MAFKIKSILVSQPKPSSEKSPYFNIEKKYDVKLVFRPFIKVEGITAKEFRAQHVNILDHTAIVFTSRHAIDHFFSLCKDLRVEIPEDMKYFCITEMVALYIQKYVQYRKRKVFFGTTGKFDSLLAQMLKRKTEKFFIPQSDVHTDEIPDLMRENDLFCTPAVMYRTVSNDFGADEPFDYDGMVFFSPAGVAALLKNFPDFEQGDKVILCMGPSTAKAVKDAGLRVDMEAPSKEYPSITSALEAVIKEHNEE